MCPYLTLPALCPCPFFSINPNVPTLFLFLGDTDPKMMKKHLNTEFVSAILACFTSRDPRLREYLKTILHRVYGEKKIILHAFTNVLRMPKHAFIYSSHYRPLHGLQALHQKIYHRYIFPVYLRGSTPRRGAYVFTCARVNHSVHQTSWSTHVNMILLVSNIFKIRCFQ